MPGLLDPSAVLNGGAPSAGPVPNLPAVVPPEPQGPTPSEQELEDSLLQALIRRGKKDRKIRLTKEQKDALVNKIISDFDSIASIRGVFREKHAQYLADWRGTVEPKDEPYENASNMKVPCISYNVEQQKARLQKATIGSTGSPIVEFSALAESIPYEAINEHNNWYNWELVNVVKFPQVLAKIIHYIMLDGISIAVPRYCIEKKRLKMVREFDLVDQVPLSQQIIMTMDELFPNAELEDVKMTGAGRYELTVNEQGRDPVPATIEYWIRNDDTLGCEVEMEVIVFDGVKIDVIPTENICAPNSADDIEKLPFFGWRGWLLSHDYVKGVKDGTYLDPGGQAGIDRVTSASGPKQESSLDQYQTEILDDEEGGDSKDLSLAGTNKNEYGWIEVYNWQGRFELEGDDLSGILAKVDPATKTLISVDRLEDITGTGERVGVRLSYIEQPDRFYAIGLAEWLQHSQAELDAIHNQRIDAGLLSNFPYFFYTPAVGSPNAILKLSPGSGYPVKDVKAILFPQNNWQPTWSFREEAQTISYAKQQAGLSDPALGNFISKRTSATEFESTTAATDVRTDLIVDHFLAQVHKLLWMVLELYRRHVPPGRVYQVAGPNGEKLVRYLNRKSLNMKLMMEMNGNTMQIDPQLQRDIAVNMFQLLSTPVLVQFGLSQPDTLYAAFGKVMKAMNYKGVPFHEPDVPKLSESPEQEVRRMIMGEVVSPSPIENFGRHIQEHTEQLNNPYIPDEAKALLQQHLQVTQLLQQQVMMMRQQAAMAAADTQGRMTEMGIRPGMAGGGQAGNNAAPGTKQEGVGTGEDEGNRDAGS